MNLKFRKLISFRVLASKDICGPAFSFLKLCIKMYKIIFVLLRLLFFFYFRKISISYFFRINRSRRFLPVLCHLPLFNPFTPLLPPAVLTCLTHSVLPLLTFDRNFPFDFNPTLLYVVLFSY